MENDVAGLLATQRGAAANHLFENILVAHRRADHLDAMGASARSRPRLDITVATTTDPCHGQLLAVLSGGPSGTAPRRHPRSFRTRPRTARDRHRRQMPRPTSALCSRTAAPQSLQVQRSAIQVDVAAVGRAMNGMNPRAQAFEKLRRQRRRRSVGAIGHDFQTAQPARQRRGQMFHVAAIQARIYRKGRGRHIQLLREATRKSLAPAVLPVRRAACSRCGRSA